MPKQNSAILLNKYIWLIDTIYSAGHITRDEIDRRWCRSLLSEDEMSIPPRTFHFRSLPLHRSQKEEETAKDYSIFSYYVVPTYELRQEILSHGANVEVVSPKALREQIKEEIAEMHKLYK